MIIKLIIDEKERSFNSGFISGRRTREALAMSGQIEGKKQDETMLDEMADFIVDLYKNQFTRDQFYDGIASDKLIGEFTDSIAKIIGTLEDKSKLLEVSQPHPKNA